MGWALSPFAFLPTYLMALKEKEKGKRRGGTLGLDGEDRSEAALIIGQGIPSRLSLTCSKTRRVVGK